ncbi:MAG: flagellar basal-body rod protein FlgG [Sphingomonadaceae bacterium]|nr:flagellar basal-body rod protein FlgG [Sphingomonadaceae bacterium]
MNITLAIARSGLEAQDTRMRVIANNLANANTTGFKRDRADFATLAYDLARPPGASAGPDAQTGALALGGGVRIVGTERNHASGSAVVTGNPLDIMVEGDGFLQVQLADGRAAFTRAGALRLDGQGRLVTGDGLQLQPAIQVPEGSGALVIAPDGTVSATPPGGSEPAELGQLQLATFQNPAGLRNEGSNLFLETPASGAPRTGTPGTDGLGRLRQGAVEGSNVSLVEELVSMIETQRAYEINSKVVNSVDEMMRNAAQMV